MAAVRSRRSGTSSPVPPLDRAVLRVAALTVFGAGLGALDTTVVNVAIDTLRRELHSSLATIQWVTTGYLLALALALPLSGWAVERLGGKRLYVVCLLAFVATSALCGAAWSADSLIVFRILQGLVAGLLAPLAQILVAQIAGPERLMRAVSIVALPVTLAPLFGPVLGGLVIGSGSWRWIFLINVPIGLLGAYLAARGLPERRGETRSPLDLRGLAMISPALVLIVYGVSRIGQTGRIGDVATLGPTMFGVALCAAFVAFSLRRSASAVLDVRLFRRNGVAAAAACLFLGQLVNFGGLLLLALYFQQVRGETPLTTGLLLAPQGLGSVIALAVVGRVAERVSPRRFGAAGAAIIALTTVPLVELGAHTSYVWLELILFVRGLGWASSQIVSLGAGYAPLSRAELPKAGTTLNIVLRVGAPFGTALAAVVLQHRLDRLGIHPTHRGSAHAFGGTFVALGIATAVLFASSLLLPRRPGRGAENVVASAT
jgi:EmrB/QacA subfamily drug resistance transporter